jgi:acyl-coenzyme A thioesterase PaaI-like protein
LSATVDGTDERARLGKAIRELGHAFIGHDARPELLEEAATTLAEVTARIDDGAVRLRVSTKSDPTAWPPELPDGRPVVTYDDRPFSGRSSPWGLDLEVHRHGDEIVGVCTLREAHEGAPGRSHGGIVAGLFDDIFGFVLDIVQEAAFTGELKIRYERPTPLHRPIACHGRLARRDGRKLWIEGEIVDVEADGQPVVARASGLFITVDPSRFAAETAKLPAPPDED